MTQVKQEREMQKQKEEAEKKIKEADGKILGAAREPFQDEEYLLIMGYFSVLPFDILVMVPMTGWSRANPYFDGLKYCGNIAQNPYNVLNVGIDNFMYLDEPLPEEFRREAPPKP